MDNIVSFQLIGRGSIQVGTFRVQDEFIPGLHNAQRTLNIVPSPGTPQPMPETFMREWATFVTPTDATTKGFDPGSYGIGVPVANRTITIPVLRPMTLLQFGHTVSTKQQKSTVAFDGDIAQAIAAGLLSGTPGAPAPRVYTHDDYIRAFAPQGFNRFGSVLPPNIAHTNVSDLVSFAGDFTNANGQLVTNTVLYLQPIYISNALPMFSFVYLQAGFRGNLSPADTLISGHLLRWRGLYVSEAHAPINRQGEAIDAGNGPRLYEDVLDVNVGENQFTYLNADAYNVVNMRRS